MRGKNSSLCRDLLVASAANSQFIHALKKKSLLPSNQTDVSKLATKILFSVGVFRHEMPVRLIKLRWRSLSGSFLPSSAVLFDV